MSFLLSLLLSELKTKTAIVSLHSQNYSVQWPRNGLASLPIKSSYKPSSCKSEKIAESFNFKISQRLKKIEKLQLSSCKIRDFKPKWSLNIWGIRICDPES